MGSSSKLPSKVAKLIMKSHRIQVPKYQVPLRLRPWFFIFTCIVLLILAFLGFTNFSHSLPVNDKVLHFLCFATATGVFYFIFDVDEDSRRIWIWRHGPLMITIVVCFLCGGILSEVVQSLLPHKEFQFGDLVANLLGASVGLCVAYYADKYYRHRREISRLYQPLDDNEPYSEDDEPPQFGASQLPLQAPHHALSPTRPTRPLARLNNVWDEREDLFDIGSEGDSVETPTPPLASSYRLHI
ncbi:hypothetical protein AX16_005223 [Volvariella volvacea WC 439]|nr:hypothetical protein AX16_005223 [Volvariella volvacea WC 439]